MSQAGSYGPIGGGGGTVNTLTGNTGLAVSPLLGNINLVGDGTTITIAGNPGTHTLTASVIGTAFVRTLSDNAGALVNPTVGGNIQLVAGANVTTTAAGNTIVIASTPATFNYTNVNTTPYVVVILDAYLSVDCSAAPITIQLPDTVVGYHYWRIKDRTGNAAIRNITVTTVTGAVLIDGNANFIMNTAYESINVVWNNVSYEVF
jgi:hypothetical protein